MRDDAIIIRISVITTMYAYGFDTPKDNCLKKTRSEPAQFRLKGKEQ